MEVCACKTGEIWKRAVGCFNVGMPVWVLYSSYIRRYYWGNLGEWYMGPFCTIFATSCASILFQKKNLAPELVAAQSLA